MDKKYLNWKNNRPNLYLNIFHPEYDNLFVAGLIQPDSGQWGLVDYQTQLIAKFILAPEQNPAGAKKISPAQSRAAAEFEQRHQISRLDAALCRGRAFQLSRAIEEIN